MPNVVPSTSVPQAPQVPRQQVQYSQPRQSATVEPVAPALEATEKKEELLSPKFAALARKEKAFRHREAQLKAREDAMKATEGTPSFDSKAFTEKMKTDPWATLSELGLTPDEITQAMLNQPKPEAVAIQKLESKLTEMEKKFGEPLTKFEEQQNQATEAALKQIRYDAKILIDSDPSFEMIKTKNMSEAVVQLIKESFDESGILMSVDEAAKEVETYLADQVFEEIKAAQQIKKIQERLNPQPVQAPQQPLAKQPLKTLTNAVSAPSSKPTLSEKERVQRAILAFKGQLK
jgi:hypothetical protein